MKEFMQCPICSSELSPNAVVCEKCGATRVTRRTPVGVIAGWAGMTVAILSFILLSPLLVLPFTEHGISGYPWTALIAGAILAAGLMWHSKSTIHSKWVRRED